jgi:DNA-binding transcriptional ArsR family regulator
LESGDVSDGVVLAPLRRRLLTRLAEPASASQLAPEFGVSRQNLNYHLRKLEEAGLVEVVAQRQRRGFTERVLRARADAYVFTLDAEVPLADLPAFTEAMAGAMAEVVARFGRPGGRRYRVIGAGHPVSTTEESDDRAA